MPVLRVIALIAAFLILFGIAFSLDNYVPPVTDSDIILPSVTEPAPPPLAGKTIVNFGDSIFGNFKPPADISSYLAEFTGAEVYNVGFGGCRMGAHPNQYDCFSMYNLAYAIANNDWTLQDETMARTDWTPHITFAGHLAALKSIDFNDVDIITISYGTNDFAGRLPLSSDDPKDTETFVGALRTSIELIRSAYPHIEIVLCTPVYRFWIDKENNNAYLYDSNTHLINDRKLTDFVQATKDIAREYGLLCIDNYFNCGINASNRSECFSETDGTHPNQTGRKKIAEYMATILLENYT